MLHVPLHITNVIDVGRVSLWVSTVCWEINGRLDVEFDVTKKQWHFISINDRNVYEFPQSTRRSCART